MVKTFPTRVIPAILAFILFANIGVAEAQYFGRNRVQYEDFDFQILETEHFDIYYYQGEAEAARVAGVLAERWYQRLSTLLNHELRGRQAVIYYANPSNFQQTNALGSTPSEGTGGVTELFKRRIVLPFAGPLAETDHVLGHELVHAFQFDMTGQGKTVTDTNYPTAVRLPLWFIEGMAEYLSLGPNDPHTTMWIRDALARDRLPGVRQLYDPAYFPYRFGQALWAYVAGRFGDETIGRILNAAGRRGTAEIAFESVLRIPMDSLIADWHESIRYTYASAEGEAKDPTTFGAPLLTKKNSGEINLAPALSPDGSRLVFLSEKDGLAIEMYLADAETGEVKRKLVKTSVDPHYESLEFIYSAGTWAPDNKRFAFGGTVAGQATLSVMDTDRGEVLREIPIEGVGEILNPSWSPDGKSIVFSANVGGLSDLFEYDFERDSVIRLTNDVYADLQPAWSPDGSQVAFVTDRFSSNAANFQFGNYRLATWDKTTGRIRPLPSFPTAKNINPQWSPDGTSLYFVADENGISNIYRLQLGSGDLSKVTDVFTGVSGITDISPAISYAANANRLTFTVFSGGDYAIYRVDDPQRLQGKFLATLTAGADTIPKSADVSSDVNAGVLPPADREPGFIQTYLADATTGLVDENSFGTEKYGPRLSLDYFSQPQLGFAISDYGTYIGAGISAFWSDMLGEHNLATAFQINGGVKDIGALVGYTNRSHRLNWGAIAGQVPNIYGYSAVGLGRDNNGNLIYIEQQQLIRQYNRQLTGVLSYPFSRVRRVELSAGLRSYGFSNELRTRIRDFNGSVISDTTENLEACFTDARTRQQVCQPGNINMAQASAALVYDNAIFGYVSPVLGQRYRIELSPSVGGLNYGTGLVDFRKYLMPVHPFTLAFRLLHYGRYGPDAEDPVLSDLYLGTQGVVRGYNYYSFTAQECAASLGSDSAVGCPAQDRLFGSRIAVANAELRFPLLQVLGLGHALLGAIPIETLVFGDAGLAWESANKPFFSGGPRDPVFSAGAGLRFNLFGLMVGELDFVRPFQRPDKGWYWQFSFTPGF